MNVDSFTLLSQKKGINKLRQLSHPCFFFLGNFTTLIQLIHFFRVSDYPYKEYLRHFLPQNGCDYTVLSCLLFMATKIYGMHDRLSKLKQKQPYCNSLLPFVTEAVKQCSIHFLSVELWIRRYNEETKFSVTPSFVLTHSSDSI